MSTARRARRRTGRAQRRSCGIVGPENLEARPSALVPYRTDATFGFSGEPLAVVRPAAPRRSPRCCGWAGRHRVPVVPSGAGTSLAAGAVPIHGGIVLP